MKKMFAVVFAALAVAACDPLATCKDSEYPEICGSEDCDDLRECCESNEGMSRVCEQVNESLGNVPELARQPVRDEACRVTLEESGDACK